MAAEMKQGELFATGPRGQIAPRDWGVSSAERPRLSRQCWAILERLRQGPATNAELAEISIKYGARISDIRHAGYVIKLIEYDRITGRGLYELAKD